MRSLAPQESQSIFMHIRSTFFQPLLLEQSADIVNLIKSPQAPMPVSDAPVDHARQIIKHGFPGPHADKLYRHAYVAAYDRRMRNAAWVAEKLTKDSIKRRTPQPGDSLPLPPDRQKSQFKNDQALPEEFRARTQDYISSGYDRGHLVPAADVQESQLAVDETFLMSNIAPQVPSFNRGIWASFERFVRGLVKNFDEVYVLTGPLYLPKQDENGKFYVKYEVIGRDKTVAVPTHFFKVILGVSKGMNYMGGFVLPNEGTEKDIMLDTFFTPVSAIERASGLNFFPEVDRKKSVSLCSVAKCGILLSFKYKLEEHFD